MKKLLLSTAIVSSAFFAGSAIAQTTITGNLDIQFKSISADTAMQSQRGFGRESQINIQNKGKLSNGMDYAAGFSIEHDGTDRDTTQSFNENTYINITSGNTTLHVGQDHIQNSQRTLANFVGLIAEDITNSNSATAANKAAADIFLDAVGGNPWASYGAGIIQNIPNIGTLSALYVPDSTAVVATSDTAGTTGTGNGNVGDDDGLGDGDSESAYEVGFVGSLGVKGLNTHAFYNKQQKTNSATATDRDIKGTNVGASYNFGQVTVGYNNKKSEFNTTTAVNNETKQHEYAVAYAISPTLTLGANYTKAKNNALAAATDAESKSIALGYNLGPVALTAQYAKTENVTGVGATANDDFDVAIVRLSTKF
jgi:predicted porin